MTKEYEDRGAEIGALLMVHALGPTVPSSQRPSYFIIGKLVARMRAYTRQAKKAAENACNYNLSERTEKTYANRRDRHEIEINSALKDWGLTHIRFELGGDPRGPCGRLHIEGMRGDGWGDGFAIY